MLEGVKCGGGIAGHQVTITIDGKEKVQLHMIDGQIENGKIKQFYIYSKGIPEPPKNDLDEAK